MSADLTWQITATSPENTEKLAEKIGQRLRGGEIIELASDLGGGKTTFVRGLARGLGSPDHVSSPTFKISNEYRGKNHNLIHFDFYRLDQAGITGNELAEALNDSANVTVIEWANIVKASLPTKRLIITFLAKGNNSRHLYFTYPRSLAYLIKDLT